jgi:hypothetical protein
MTRRDLLSFAIIAARLHYAGSDRERSVLRLFRRHGLPFVKRSRGAYFATEDQYDALIEKLTCLPSENAANISTSGARSVSGGKRVSSKNILAARIAATMQTRTDQNSKPKPAAKSFTVVEGGRTA